MGETMAKKKLRSNALYFNFGLAVIWDVIGFFLFILSLFAIGVPFSVVLDFVAVGTSLLFRYLHKAYFLKTTREIKADFKAIKKAVKRSKKKAIAQQYAKARAQLDLWVDQGLRFLMREIIRMLMTFLLELMPFLGDFSPTWSIKAYFELYKFGQQKKKYQLLLYQIQAMEALLKAEEKFAPGYAKLKKRVRSTKKIMDGDFSEVKENLPGYKQYQGVKQGVQKGLEAAQAFDTQAQKVVNQAVNAATNARARLTAARQSSLGYQQRVQREEMIKQQQMRYNETRSSGGAYYNSPSAQGSIQNQMSSQDMNAKDFSRTQLATDQIDRLDGKNDIKPFSRSSQGASNSSNKTQKELQNA